MVVALASVPFSFSGGDAGDLVRRLVAGSNRPVVALVQGELARPRQFGRVAKNDPPQWKDARRLTAFKIDPEAAKDGARLRWLKPKTGLEVNAAPSGISLWDAAWQQTTTSTEFPVPEPNGWTEASPQALHLTGGRVSITLHPKEAVQVTDVARMPWSKPLVVHWLLSKMWVVPETHNARERDVLETLAKAISGRLVEEKAAWRIDLDPVAFRPRAIATVDLLESQGYAHVKRYFQDRSIRSLDLAVVRTGADLCRTTWRVIDDASIAELFAKPLTGIAREASAPSALWTVVDRYVNVYREWTNRPPEGREAPPRPIENCWGTWIGTEA